MFCSEDTGQPRRGGSCLPRPDRGVTTVEKTSTFSLTPGQLARLLALGAEEPMPGGKRGSDTQLAALLRDRLVCPLTFEREAIDALPPALGAMCRELAALANRSLGEVLLDSRSELNVLEAVKEYGKRLAARPKDGREHTAALAIYYAAVAGALVFHNRRITRHTCESLSRAFGTLAGRSWVPQDLAALFAEVQRVCQASARCT